MDIEPAKMGVDFTESPRKDGKVGHVSSKVVGRCRLSRGDDAHVLNSCMKRNTEHVMEYYSFAWKKKL